MTRTAVGAIVRTDTVQPTVRRVIELTGLSRTFGAESPVHALRGVDLTIRPGEWVAIVGPSGSGKSTLLNVVGLLDRQTAGSYLFDGVEVAALDDLGRAGLRGRRIGFVFQSFHLLPHRNVLENVMLAEIYIGAPRRGRRERALLTLARVGLSDRADFLPSRLSGGQQQRAAIARALMADPTLLLCDEPTGNLDSTNAEGVLDLFGELADEGLTLAVITHDDHVAARAHRRVRIVDGVLSEVPPAMMTRPAAAGATVARPRLGPRDLFDECLASLLARPGRAVLTVLGTVVGVAALVATLGLSKTAGNQIVGRFDGFAATDIVVTAKKGASGVASTVLPWDAEARMTRLNGVAAAGTLSDVDLKGQLVRAVPVNDPQAQTEFQVPVVAASPGLFQAVRAGLVGGRVPDAGHSQRADRVAVLGPNAAARLRVTTVDTQPAIYLGDRLFVVIGVLSGVERQPSLLGSVVIPEGTAQLEYGLVGPGSVQVETQIGAVGVIAGQAPMALSPNDPALVKITAPPEPRRARAGVQSDLNSLFLLLGGVSLLVGAIGIANVTLVSVLERVGEIGLRRALGAARRHIAAQFLVESTTLGLAGGIVGAALGTLVVVGVAASRSWTPVLEAWVPVGAPLLGGGIGLLSGVYPSARAAALEPVEALRSAI